MEYLVRDGLKIEASMDGLPLEMGGIKVSDCRGWWVRPSFLLQMEKKGIPMVTYGDLLDWLSKPEVLKDLKELSKYGDFTYYLDDFVSLQNDKPELVPGTNAEKKMIQVVKSRGNSSGFLLLEEPESSVYYLSRLTLQISKEFKLTVTPRVESTSPSFWYKLNNYSFRPEFKFLSLPKEKQHLYFGLELEVSSRLAPYEFQCIVTGVEPKQEPFFYFKQDSSITGKYDHNVEIVTMPSTPKFLKKNFRIFFGKLERLVEEKVKGQDLSWVFDTSPSLNNGLHIHVSSDAFIRSSLYDKSHKSKFLTALNQWDTTFQTFLKKVTKRHQDIATSQFCHINPDFDGLTLARRLSGRRPSMRDRHSSCHDTGGTVEVRVFYGLPTLKHIYSCIEFTQSMFYYTQYVPNSAFGPRFVQHFKGWLSKQPGYLTIKENV